MILLSSNIVPVRGRTAVEYFTYKIVLKDGQDIIGAADDGFEIVVMSRGHGSEHMVEVGTSENFRFGETRDSHIKHLTFRPLDTPRVTQTVASPNLTLLFSQNVTTGD